MGKRKSVIRAIIAVGLLILPLFSLFRPLFFGKIPFPGDVLIGHYHPWVDSVWEGRVAGYPIKNFIVDPLVQSFPWREFSLSQMMSGQWPLWNPYNVLGMPLFAVGLPAPFYPLNIFLVIFGMNWGWAFLVVITPVIAGLGFYLWLRNQKISYLSSLLAASTWAFCGLLVDKIENVVDAHSFVWLPFGLIAVDKFFFSKNKKWLLLMTMAICFNWLAGYPPQAMSASAVIFLWGLYRLFKGKKALIFFIIVFVLSHAVLSFYLFPIAELSFQAKTSGAVNFMAGEPYFLPWINLIMMLVPRFFGHPATLNSWLPSPYIGERIGIGIVALIFSFVGISLWKRDKDILFWLGAVIISALLFLPTPLGKFIQTINLPFISSITPMKLAWVFDFGLLFLVAKGVDFWLSSKKSLWAKIIVGFLWIVVFVLIYFAFKVGFWQKTVALRNMVIPIGILGVSSLIIFTGSSASKRVKGVALILFIFISLFELTKDASYYLNFIPSTLMYPETKILKFLKNQGPLWRTMVTDPNIFPVNTNLSYSIPMVNGYSSLYPFRSGQLVSLNYQDSSPSFSGFKRTVYQADIGNPMRDLLGVKYILSLKKLDEKYFSLVMEEGKTKLYLNNNALPKVWFAKRWDIGSSDTDVARKLLAVKKNEEVILERPIGLSRDLQTTESSAEVKEYLPEKIEIKTINANSGLLLINDAYYPGWVAEIDGRKTTIYRADYNLRAVIVPAGEHRLEVFYRPKSFRLGMVGSLAGLVGILLVFVLTKERQSI